MATKSGSFDTNALLRLMLNDAPEQHLAVKKLLNQTGSQYFIADTAMVELVFVLIRYYKFSRPQVAEAINGIAQLKAINCNRVLFEEALFMFVEHPGLSFEDCCLAIYAKLNDSKPLWTFDKKLANQTSYAKLVKL